MKPIYRHWRAISLVLVIFLIESIMWSYIFDSLAKISANFERELQFTPDERFKSSNPSSRVAFKAVKGPNGTEYVLEIVETASVKAEASGEYFDYSAYIRHIIFWKTLENFSSLIRDYYRELSESMIFMFCALLLMGIEIKVLFLSNRQESLN